AVPEPGSIALLSGLGLVVGRRLLKRRAKKQEAAV
ncbi:MAG: PEP-CTERM sorting domain-containing protein, partial [Planctomycetaceae bacterium]